MNYATKQDLLSYPHLSFPNKDLNSHKPNVEISFVHRCTEEKGPVQLSRIISTINLNTRQKYSRILTGETQLRARRLPGSKF